MKLSLRVFQLLLAGGGVFLAADNASAGPPFITDDPEPVEYQHWEVYIASILNHESGLWSGTAPHIEVNYGAVPELQLHVIAPLSFSSASDSATHFGYGDTELGIKYRFIQETTNWPQVGVFPLLEVPTGDEHLGLGSGHLQAFLPVWWQKSFGQWTTYGGGGYWINPGNGNRNWWYGGWLLQRQVTQNLAIGGELFHETAQQDGGSSHSGFNIGTIYDFSEHHHLLLSAGHTFQGPGAFQAYLAFQFTFGPKSGSEK